MTIKKSLISVAASAAIIAAVTGCSSDSTTAATTTTPTTGVQSAVKAVDGYVYNALVKAYYVKEDNATMGSVTLTATQTLNDTSTNPATVAVGSSTYSLSAADDANASIKNRIKFFTLADDPVNAGIAKSATSFAPASYIESDGIKGYDANDTLVGTTVLYAPANSGMITPITSLVYHATAAQLGTTTTAGTDKGDANTTIFTALEANATKIATNLGLSGVNLLTADAVELSTSNPTFALVNALLKDGSNTAATATSILGATAATSLATTIANVATALPAGTNGKTFAQDLQTRAENGSFKTTDIAALNIEKSVADGQYTTLAAPVIKGKIAVNGITIGGTDSATLSSTTAGGAKWKVADTVDMNMSLSSADANVSNTTFNLYVVIDGDRTSIDADSNISSGVVAKIPFDLNLTAGAPETAGVATTTMIPFEARSKNGDQIVNTEINASDLAINGTTFISANAATETVSFDVNGLVGKLVTAADLNLSTNTSGTLMTTISRVQVLLEDASGKLIAIEDATRGSAFATTNLTDLGISKIIANEAIKLLDSTTLDMRSATSTGANSAQAVTNFGTATHDATITEDNSTGTIAIGETINVNLDSNTSAAAADYNLTTFTINMGDKGVAEKNVKVLGAITDTNVTGFVTVPASKDINGTGTLNLTLDTYPSVTSGATGHPTSIVSFTTTDEFGKASNAGDYNLTFQLNRPATLDSNVTNLVKAVSGTPSAFMVLYYSTVASTSDVNLTYLSRADVNSTDGNLTSVKFTATDPDTSADYTVTDGNISFVAGACLGATATLNAANANTVTITKDGNDTNLTFLSAGAGIFYPSIDTNGSGATALVAGNGCNFTIESYDGLGATGITDYNITVRLSN